MQTTRDRAYRLIENLESVYYLLQAVDDHHQSYWAELREAASRLPRSSLRQFLTHLRKEIGQVRKETKCRLADEDIVAFVKTMNAAGDGYVYLPKWYIDRHLFGNYARVFPRWPHIPPHALVLFDSKIDGKSPNSILVPEADLFEDVKLLWEAVKNIISDGRDFRSRPRTLQRQLYSYLRLAATAIYRYLEAHLNGIAFDCFWSFHPHLSLADHDFLAEWDSDKKRPKFVSFEHKVAKYPEVCGRYLGKEVNLRGDPNAEFLLKEGKPLRDSLTHPSPYVNFDKDDPGKIARMIGITPDQTRRLL